MAATSVRQPEDELFAKQHVDFLFTHNLHPQPSALLKPLPASIFSTPNTFSVLFSLPIEKPLSNFVNFDLITPAIMTTPKKPHNIWTAEQRQVLYLLYNQSTYSGEGKTAVFNDIFSDELKACGLPDGVTRGVIRSQYAERDRYSTSPWTDDLKQLRTDDALQDRLLEQIQAAATTLGVEDNSTTPAAGIQQVAFPERPIRTPKRKRSAANITGFSTSAPDIIWEKPPPRRQPAVTPSKARPGWKGWQEVDSDEEAKLQDRRKALGFEGGLEVRLPRLRGGGASRSSPNGGGTPASGFGNGQPQHAQPGDAGIRAAAGQAGSGDEGTGATSGSANEDTEDQQDEEMPDAPGGDAPNSNSNDNNGSNNDDNEENDRPHPTNGPRPNPGPVPVNVNLQMLHRMQVRWDGNRGSVDNINGLPIDPNSAWGSEVHRHSGIVHRITIGGAQQADYMICDREYCIMCNEDADDNLPAKTGGMPFVHSSDTTRVGEITFFTPKPKPNSGEMTEGFTRRVRFQTLWGEISCVVRVCGFAGCDVCEGYMQRLEGIAQASAGADGHGGGSNDEDGEDNGEPDGSRPSDQSKGRGKGKLTLTPAEVSAIESSRAVERGQYDGATADVPTENDNVDHNSADKGKGKVVLKLGPAAAAKVAGSRRPARKRR